MLKAIASDHFNLKDVNAMTDKLDHIQAIDKSFALTMTKAGKCSLLAVHFDIWFEAGMPNPVFFSTSPAAKPTHWKQTLFYLDTPMMVEVGDVIEGNLKASQCVGDERHWDIEFQYKSGTSMTLRTQKYRI